LLLFQVALAFNFLAAAAHNYILRNFGLSKALDREMDCPDRNFSSDLSNSLKNRQDYE